MSILRRLRSIMSKGIESNTKHVDTCHDVYLRRLIALDFIPLTTAPLKPQPSYLTISADNYVKLSPALRSLLGISSSTYLKHAIVILLLNGYIINHNGYDSSRYIKYDKNLWTILQIPQEKQITMQTIVPYLMRHYV
jgi:chromatin remodeling complex protein RSC6